MRVGTQNYRTVWMSGQSVFMIEQNKLPFRFEIYESKTHKLTAQAIETMIVRGAGAIGATAAFAMAQAALEAKESDYKDFIADAKRAIEATRPTAQNLFMATNRVYRAALISPENAVNEAQKISDEDAFASEQIGKFGADLIADGMGLATHCNAGWLAFVDYGTALSPIYTAHKQGKSVFVFVDETRPRSQGARLTAWELHNENVPHAIIADNATAHYMQQGRINMMIVGADRIARNGDVANKIGTLEKALAANYFGIPFYVAAPSSTFDFNCKSGHEIPIEERNADELLWMNGVDECGNLQTIRVASPGSTALNPAFDVTPAALIAGIITEKGIINPTEKEIIESIG